MQSTLSMKSQFIKKFKEHIHIRIRYYKANFVRTASLT